MDSELTICTVSFASRLQVELNMRLTRALNPDPLPNWIVVENSSADSPERVVPREDLCAVVLEGPPLDGTSSRPRSFHHGAALNLAVGHVRTRYLLVLDPDFYIVRPDWVRAVLDFMRAGDLAFFGAPWHPRWYVKPRYFPCVQCLFVDLQRVPARTLDFRPGEGGLGSDEHWSGRIARFAGGSLAPRQAGAQSTSSAVAYARRLGRVVVACVDNVLERRRIETSQDTGFNVYRLARSQRALRTDCVQPVFRPGADCEARGPLRMSLALDWLLPDRLSYIPKISGSFATTSFAELGYPDMKARRWEEFVWLGKPFGFHLRGQKRVKDPHDDAAELDDAVRAWVHTHRKEHVPACENS
jgi:hypothetical protein